MRQITIGDKPLMQISQVDLMELAVILGCCPCLDYWSYPEIVDFCDTMFSDTIVIVYHSKKIDGEYMSDPIEFFFKTNGLSFHYHRQNESCTNVSNRLSIEVIKFLIEKGYDVPIY